MLSLLFKLMSGKLAKEVEADIDCTVKAIGKEIENHKFSNWFN